MKTVYDLIRHRSTLEVICGNCGNRRALNHRFLVSRFGQRHYLAQTQHSCHQTQSSDHAV
jgi:hypothetical protein